MILETKALTKRFGGLTAIDDLHFSLETGELRCLVGPNGAGKTTLFHLVTGKEKPTAGAIYFQGEVISHLPIHQIAQKGIGRKFQIPNVYEHLTAYDNLAVAFQHFFSLPSLLRRSLITNFTERVMTMLYDIGLADKHEMPAAYLSHGEKQWLEIGMVLVSQPQILLLDEPTAGMTAEETKKTIKLIQEFSARKLTMLVIGHDMHFIRAIAHKVTVLHKGRIIAEGDIREVEKDQLVRDIYLGKV